MRQKEALKMAKGRWKTRPEHLSLDKIKELLMADDKRRRETYDSYQLVMERRNISSKAWNFDEYVANAEYDFLGLFQVRS